VTSTAQVILNAARRVVARAGPRQLTISAVAAEAGVSRPTLYRWFPTKDLLLAAMAAEAVERFDAGLRQVIAAQPGSAQRLGAALRYLVRYLEDVIGPAAIAADPEFALQSLADSMGSHVVLLTELLGGALDAVPAVAQGTIARAEAAEIFLRVAYSHYLVPHRDADELLDVLGRLAGIPVSSTR
jgi:AcrR family transcriptional regulator